MSDSGQIVPVTFAKLGIVLDNVDWMPTFRSSKKTVRLDRRLTSVTR